MPKFDDEAAIEVAYGNDDVNAFEEKHPDCVVNIIKMSPKDTTAWLDKNPKVDAGDRTKLKNLYAVELDDIGKEKLIAVLSPISKKVLEVRTEESAALPEDEDEE